MSKRLAIAGSGAIACGLAATAAHHGPVLLLARSESSAERARATRREDARPPRRRDRPRARPGRDRSRGARRRRRSWSRRSSRTTTSRPGCSANWTRILAPEAILASTTSSLSVERLAQASGRPERFVGLHVFNPVTKMKLVELIFPERRQRGHAGAARSRCARRSRRRPSRSPTCPASSSTACCSPTCSAPCGCWKRPAWTPSDVDTCMRLGAGHPMGPLALLDLVGLDVAAAIGETIGEPTCPPRLQHADRRGRARAQERPRLPRLLDADRSCAEHLSRLNGLLAAVHQAGDTCSMRPTSRNRTPASSQCTRSGPLPPRAGRV